VSSFPWKTQVCRRTLFFRAAAELVEELRHLLRQVGVVLEAVAVFEDDYQ
jgi:hypothetical protein